MNDFIFCSWSGGKDCCLALDRFLMEQKTAKIILLTMLKENDKKTYGHYLNENMLRKQADSMNMRIAFGYAGLNNYEEKWTAELLKLKKLGFTAGVFGDIDLEEHYIWIKKVMQKVGMEMIMPLWKCNREAVVSEFINKNYKAKIISVNTEKINEKYLGKEINFSTFQEMKNVSIDPSGEGGEFHTYVYSGPLFKKQLEFKDSQLFNDNSHIFIKYNEFS